MTCYTKSKHDESTRMRVAQGLEIRANEIQSLFITLSHTYANSYYNDKQGFKPLLHVARDRFPVISAIHTS